MGMDGKDTTELWLCIALLMMAAMAIPAALAAVASLSVGSGPWWSVVLHYMVICWPGVMIVSPLLSSTSGRVEFAYSGVLYATVMVAIISIWWLERSGW